MEPIEALSERVVAYLRLMLRFVGITDCPRAVTAMPGEMAVTIIADVRRLVDMQALCESATDEAQPFSDFILTIRVALNYISH